MAGVVTFATGDAPDGLLDGALAVCWAAFPTFAEADWDHALGGVHVVALDGDRVVAHGSVIPRTLEIDGQAIATGYVEAVAAEPDRHGAGLGTAVVTEIGAVIRSRYQLGALATEAYHFYERLGWVRWAGTTGVRRADGQVEPTPEDDDAIMVLRFGATSDVGLGGLITCDDRMGDVW